MKAYLYTVLVTMQVFSAFIESVNKRQENKQHFTHVHSNQTSRKKTNLDWAKAASQVPADLEAQPFLQHPHFPSTEVCEEL